MPEPWSKVVWKRVRVLWWKSCKGSWLILVPLLQASNFGRLVETLLLGEILPPLAGICFWHFLISPYLKCHHNVLETTISLEKFPLEGDPWKEDSSQSDLSHDTHQGKWISLSMCLKKTMWQNLNNNNKKFKIHWLLQLVTGGKNFT